MKKLDTPCPGAANAANTSSMGCFLVTSPPIHRISRTSFPRIRWGGPPAEEEEEHLDLQVVPDTQAGKDHADATHVVITYTHDSTHDPSHCPRHSKELGAHPKTTSNPSFDCMARRMDAKLNCMVIRWFNKHFFSGKHVHVQDDAFGSSFLNSSDTLEAITTLLFSVGPHKTLWLPLQGKQLRPPPSGHSSACSKKPGDDDSNGNKHGSDTDSPAECDDATRTPSTFGGTWI